jgi:hypothetical protein
MPSGCAAPLCYMAQNWTRKVEKKPGDSGSKVNIFGGDSMGHCEEKFHMNMLSNSEWHLKRAVPSLHT